MALNQYLSLPAAANGLTPASSASAWAFGSWVVASASLGTDIYVNRLTFQITNVPSLDTTVEQLFEIGVGAGGSEVTKVQIPYSFRVDSLIGYYHTRAYTIYLPEMYTIAAGSRVSVRCTDSLASAITYNGVKIGYLEGAAPAVTRKALMLLGCGS